MKVLLYKEYDKIKGGLQVVADTEGHPTKAAKPDDPYSFGHSSPFHGGSLNLPGNNNVSVWHGDQVPHSSTPHTENPPHNSPILSGGVTIVHKI